MSAKPAIDEFSNIGSDGTLSVDCYTAPFSPLAETNLDAPNYEGEENPEAAKHGFARVRGYVIDNGLNTATKTTEAGSYAPAAAASSDSHAIVRTGKFSSSTGFTITTHPVSAGAVAGASPDSVSTITLNGHCLTTEQEVLAYYAYGVTGPIPDYSEKMWQEDNKDAPINIRDYIKSPLTLQLYESSSFVEGKIPFKLAQFVHSMENSILRNSIINEEFMHGAFRYGDYDIQMSFTMYKKAALEIEAKMRAGLLPTPHTLVSIKS